MLPGPSPTPTFASTWLKEHKPKGDRGVEPAASEPVDSSVPRAENMRQGPPVWGVSSAPTREPASPLSAEGAAQPSRAVLRSDSPCC
jgi:hypothetical protein